MQSVHLNIQDSVYEQFLGFLAKFKNEEVKIVDIKDAISEEEFQFLKDKIEIHEIYDRYKAGNSTIYSQEEFERLLEN